MINFISGILGAIIRVIYNIVGQNYLVTLILFTILTKVLLFPLVLKQQRSTQDIQKVSPKVNELREKYKDNPTKMNEELTKLYADNKISPMGGCLMPIIQIIIILAMYYVVKQPLTYIAQMSQEDIYSYTAEYLNTDVENVTENIAKQYEISIAKEYNLLDMSVTSNINLGDTPKYAFSDDETQRVSKWTLLIPILSLIVSLISQQVSFRSSRKTMSEDQLEMQKSMNLMMPILSAYIAYAWPIALGVYWLCGNLLSILQQYITNRIMGKDDEDKDDKKKNKILFLGKGENNE